MKTLSCFQILNMSRGKTDQQAHPQRVTWEVEFYKVLQVALWSPSKRISQQREREVTSLLFPAAAFSLHRLQYPPEASKGKRQATQERRSIWPLSTMYMAQL